MLDGDFSSAHESRPAETLERNEKKRDDDEPSSSTSNLADSELDLKNSEALSKGISSILGAVIRNFDCSAENAVKSQDQLSFSIDRLTRELDQLLEDAPLPFIMQHATKISAVRKRVSSLNSVLKSIQRRIDGIDRMLSAGLSHGKATNENAGQQQH